MRERREVLYSGMVQGVGFRYTTAHVARRYRVEGFVKNLPDGRVQLVVQGTVDELDRLLAEVAAAFNGMITDVQVQRLPVAEFDGFCIRY
jgi:acylphosphatase